MSRFDPPSNLFDSPYLVGRSVVKGDPKGALEAVFDPASLTPEQIGWTPKDDSVISTVLKSAGPLVAMGLVLSHVYPIGGAAKLITRAIEGADQYKKYLPPFIWNLLPQRMILRGTKAWDITESFLDAMHEYKQMISDEVGGGLRQYATRAGKIPGFREQTATMMVMENLHADPNHRVWGLVKALGTKFTDPEYAGWRNEFQEDALKKAGVSMAELRAMMESGRVGVLDAKAIEGAAPRELVESGKRALMKGWDKVFENPEQIQRMIEQRTRKNGPVGTIELLKFAHSQGVDIPGIPMKNSMVPEFWEKLTEKQAEKILGKVRTTKEFAKAEFGWRPEYTPHISDLTDLERQQMVKEILAETPGSRRAKTMAANPYSDRMEEFRNQTIPDPDDLEVYAKDLVNPETLTALKYLKGMGIRTYSLRFTSVMERYGHSMGKTYGWVVKGFKDGEKTLGHGAALKAELEGPMWKAAVKDRSAGIRYKLMADTYMPLMLGKPSPSEAFYALGWGQWKTAAHEFFKKPEVRDTIGASRADWFLDQIQKPEIQNLTFKNAGAKLAGWIYASTLGLNASSAGLNMLQNMVTTPGVVPPKYLAAGYREAGERGSRMMKLLGEGKGLEEAFEKAYPEYLAIAGQSESEIATILQRAKAGGLDRPVMDAATRIQSLMMAPFSATERANKMVAYYAGQKWAMAEGLSAEQAHLVGRRVVGLTQFPGGITDTPTMFLNWWPPLRQFTQFPARTLGLFTSDPGTAGRMMVSSGLLYGAGKAAGLDLSRGLVFGALPAPSGEDSPWFPLPISPPLFQMAGAALSDAFTGKWEQVPRELPLLAPGGVALARASTIVAPGVAKALGRSFVDWSQPGPDGTFPVFSADGSLKGYQTPMRMVLDGLGWKGLTGDQEAEMMNYLVKQRDKIRGIRREYIEAIAANDMNQASKVQEQYKRLYPGMGEIAVKKSDVQAVHLRHDVARMERILDTLPPEHRKVYGAMIASTLGDMGDQFMGIDPALLSTRPTARSRDTGRRLGPSQATQNMQKATQGPRIRPDQSGNPANKVPFAAFPAFDSY